VPNLTQYRRALAVLVGVYEQGTADAGASSTTQLVCTTGLLSGARLKSTTFAASLFNGKWLYLPGAAADDRSRLIDAAGGYDPAAGTLVPDQPWAVDPDTLSDRTFEITSLFSGPDLNDLVNEGLQRCHLVVDTTFQTADNRTTHHDLTAAMPWLADERHVLQVGELAAGEVRGRTDPFNRTRRGQVRADGTGTLYLDGPSFPTTSTVYVKAIKRAYAHCRPVGGVYGAQSGLSLETDEAPLNTEWVAWGAVMAGADRLAHLESVGQAGAEAMRSRQMAAARFSLKTHEYFRPPRRTLEPLTYIGSTPGWRRAGWGR
jgi:hypothetical protein